MPPRLWAFPIVGLPGRGLSRSWAFPVVGPPGFGPSQLCALSFVGHPVCGPARFRVLRFGLPGCCFVVVFSRCLSGSPYLVDFRCGFSTARRALPVPFFEGRPVCSGRTDGRYPLRWLSCQIFFDRTPVVFPRRCPIRRQFLDGCPFSWIYARPSWAGGWPVPTVPAKLAVFLLGRRPALSRGVSSGRTPSCFLGGMDELELTRVFGQKPVASSRLHVAPPRRFFLVVTWFFRWSPVSSFGGL